MLRLQELLHGTDIIVISDEVYEHMVFDGEIHRSMSRHPELAARSIVVTSFGKTYQVTGWRVGCCVVDNNICCDTPHGRAKRGTDRVA